MIPNRGRRPCICGPDTFRCECDPLVRVMFEQGDIARDIVPASKWNWRKRGLDFDIAKWEPA